ncbi:alpha-amylase family glycosyl hydrolase [Oscillospiraceae bacterium PP1C4]
MSTILYDSRDARCKTPFGAVRTDEAVTFRVFLPISYQLKSPCLLMYQADYWDSPERIPMEFEASDGVQSIYRCIFHAPNPQLYFYLFEVTGVDGAMTISLGADGFGSLSTQGSEKWQLTVYDKHMHAPEFLKKGVMYQIFPDRFYNSGKPKEAVPSDRQMHTDWYELPTYLPDQNGEVTNSDYFGGDLAGITEKLPYLKSLGVTSIYMNPIFEAHSNHRYNTADYLKIDPLLGNEADFQTLCAKAKELGMHIILDGVFNHTGSDSVYFNKNKRYGDGGAYNDPDSPYRSWYEFTDYPHYQSWWGFETLPNLNENDPAYSEFICGENGVLKKWLRLGLSGYRLDVADELPDAFLDKICACVKDFSPEAAVIGEVWEDATTKLAYGVRRRYFLGKQLDSVMNYPFKDAILAYIRHGDCNGLYSTIMTILEHYPKPALDVLMNSLSTHDVERAITALSGEPIAGNGREWQGQNNTLSPDQYAHGKRLFRLASVIQYMLPGIPCLYYGDEAGLYGYKDPFNRTCYPWGREDCELLEVFRALGKIRTDYPMLSTGRFCAVSFTPELAAFVRDCGNVRFYVAVNRTDHVVSIPVPAEFRDARTLFGEHSGNTLAPFGCVIQVC